MKDANIYPLLFILFGLLVGFGAACIKIIIDWWGRNMF